MLQSRRRQQKASHTASHEAPTPLHLGERGTAWSCKACCFMKYGPFVLG